jgi:hypothetical protein
MMKTAETRIARSGIILGAVSALTLAISSGAMAAGSMTEYTTAQISVGNAGSECGQLGELLGTEFPYAYKWNEATTEGAPDGVEVANFFDTDGNVEHSNSITIENSDGKIFGWGASNTIGAVMVKAGTGYNVYTYDPQAPSDSGLVGYQGKDVSHVTFCWIKDELQELGSEWCSPGYWRQAHHFDSWPTGYAPADSFYGSLGYYPQLSKQGSRANAATNPTLGQVLSYPQYYGGDAFNAIGDLLSAAHTGVNFGGERVEDSCPLN